MLAVWVIWSSQSEKWHRGASSALSTPYNIRVKGTQFMSTDDFIENTKIVAEKTGNLDLWHEMFGDEEEGGSSLDDNN
jgi:hypothetical protein